MTLYPQLILDALSTVRYPGTGKNIVEMKYENLLHDNAAQRLLEHIDVLVDGPFVEALRDEDLLFRGSSNQRLIDVPRTRREGCIAIWQRD